MTENPRHDGERRVVNAGVCRCSFEMLTAMSRAYGASKVAVLDALIHLAAQVDEDELIEVARRLDSDRRKR